MPMVSTDIELPPVPTETYTSQPIPAEVPSSDVTSMEGIVDTPHTNTSDADVTQGAEVAEPPLGNPAAFQAIIQTMVDNVNKLIASDTAVGPQSFSSEGLPTPSATDERWPHPESLPLKTSSDLLRNALANDPKKFYTEEVTPTRTNIKTATVIARHRGLASGTISIDFSINQNQLNSISRWSARSKHSDEIEKSLCITLLCFLAADVRARLESSESRDLRTILPDLECSWPKTGGLSMNALWNGQRMDFPMSPPFALPSNGLVDVSQFLVLGQNTLRFTQTRDMSKYWLILCAHHPTPSQLNAVARRRHKERDWTGWLDKISQPLQLPFKIPVEV
ncbi:hypothetical protein DFH09DRAFT_13437 [Mycena vulgaris]|nr:hypothetical protein DFH09DRAFT_13437 [Mycena vulgaris]